MDAANTIKISQNTPSSDTAAVIAQRAIAITLAVLAVGLLFIGVVRFYTVLFTFFTAITLHIALNSLVKLLRRRGMSATLATLTAYGIALVGLGGFMALVVPFIVEQAATISERLPTYYGQARAAILSSSNATLISLANGLPATINLMAMIPNAPFAPNPAPASVPIADGASVTLLITNVFSVIAIVVLAFYWTLNNDRLTYSLALRITESRRESARALIAEMEDKIGAFFRGQIILCATVGVLQLIAYMVIGLPYALVLALIAFVCEAIPMIGPALGAVPAFVVALAIAPDKAVFVIISTLIIQQVENNVLVPRVMDRTVGVNAIVVILAITASSVLFGLVGALLAIPLAAILQIVFNHVLFQKSDAETTTSATDLTMELQASGGRDHVSVLRMEAREIAEDVRKQMRKHDTASALPETHASVEDTLEAIALDLDSLLAKSDRSTQSETNVTVQRNSTVISPVVLTDVVIPQVKANRAKKTR